MNTLYNTKHAGEIKDMHDEKREVAIYLSKFDNIDSDNDMIVKGAFKKSIREHGPNSKSNRKIQFLRYHDWEKPIGKFLTLEEDEIGLYAVAKLSTSTLGDDAFKDYAEGIIREHSIGFQYIPDKMRYVEDKATGTGYNLIKEVKLWEGSAVTFGSNDDTNVVEVMKSENKKNYISQINVELNTILKSLGIGQGSDERLYALEMRAKYLSSQLVLLATKEPSELLTPKNSQPADEKSADAFNWAKVVKALEQ